MKPMSKKELYLEMMSTGAVNLTFGDLLEIVKLGGAMRLPHWQADVKIKGQFPDKHSKMTHPYMYVESRHGNVPWIPTIPEMFSEKWEVYNPELA